jgi:hypothetical protein
MTLDNVPPSYVNNAPDRLDSLYSRHLNHHQQDEQQQEYVPVSIEDAAYTTGHVKTTDNFRKRNAAINQLKRGQEQQQQDELLYDSSDIDLNMFDSKSSKLRQKKEQARRASRKRDWYIVAGLTVWAMYIRLYKISQPSSVVFDEVHFGGFATKYIKTRFFMDVHPPVSSF